ncbi:hypothetical protein [Haploplasma axanthum]|uniref:hypothetical protein n=1 Tax=Haploplasma axanthum TaxID=29552 RepID=UPI0012EBFDE3|nr:hypothetical protein [Haploplasma axanthum]
MSNSQKKNLYREYELGIAEGFIPGPKLSFDNYFKNSDLFDMIEMKCLDCHFELNLSYEHFSMDVLHNEAAFPLDFCPECGKLQFVPKDVFKKLIPFNVLK